MKDKLKGKKGVQFYELPEQPLPIKEVFDMARPKTGPNKKFRPIIMGGSAGHIPPMKALTWKHPFSALMLHGKIETRVWDTKYRGPVLICEGKTRYSEMDLIGLCGEPMSYSILKKFLKQNLGHAIAVGDLVGTRLMRPEDATKCFVKYNPNLYCHFYDNVRPIDPIPWKGKQGWATVPEETVLNITFK